MAWSWLLASATGLRGPIPTTRTRQVCIARAGPAIALFGKSRGNDLVLRELDTLKPTLSYQGWQRDVAEVESDYTKYSGSRIPASTLAKVRKKQQLHDGDRGDALLRELDTLKPTLSYQGWQRDVAEVERYWAMFSRSSSTPASTLAMVRKKQQLHERVHKVTSPPPPPIANAEVPPLPLPGATSTDMPTASCARISRTDAGTLEIYIPPGRTTLSVEDEVATIGVLLSAFLYSPLADAANLPRLLAPLLSFGVGLVMKRRLIDPAADTTLTIGQYAWKLRRTVAGVVTQEEEGATETLRGTDTLLLFKHRGVYRTELRLYAAGKQAVRMDVVLQSPEEGDVLAANVNAYLQGLETEPKNDAGEEIKQGGAVEGEGSLNLPRAHGGFGARILAHVRRWW